MRSVVAWHAGDSLMSKMPADSASYIHIYVIYIYSRLGMDLHHYVLVMIKRKPDIRLWRHTSTSADSTTRRILNVLHKHRTLNLQGQTDLTKLLFWGKNLSCGSWGSRKPGNKEMSILWYVSGRFYNT